MKKWFILGLSALFALQPLASPAEEAYCSISTLRAQAPAKWTQTFETQWRTVAVDAEILLPEVDAVPVITVGCDQRKPLLTAEQSGWDTVESRDNGSLLLYNDEIVVPKKVDGKRINSTLEAKGAWYAGYMPENTYVPLSDVSFGEICAQINSELTRFGYNPDDYMVDRPSRLWAQHWYYYGKKQDALPGQILIQAYQKMNGIPLLSHIWSAVCDHDNGEFRVDEYFELLTANLSVCYDAYAEGITQIYIKAEKQNGVLAADVPLCPLDKVKTAVEVEIRAGRIRKVFELQFGYTLYNQPGLYRAKGDESVPYDTLCYYAKPIWLVNCLYASSPTAKLRTYTEIENNGDERNSLNYRQLVVDAQTGEMVQESNAKDRCAYKGFISWDDVGGRP